VTAPQLGFVAIARTTFDMELAATCTQQAYDQLRQAFDLHGNTDLITDLAAIDSATALFSTNPPDLLVVFQASFADSTMILRLAERINAPLLLWAVPEARTGGRLRLNSFCGINLAGHALRRAGYRYEYLFAAPDDATVLEKITPLARAAYARRKLHSARVGRVGEHPDGFETCIPNTAAIQTQLGADIVQFELETVFEQVREVEKSAAVDALYEQVGAQVGGLDGLDRQATRGTLGTYLTLRDLAEKQRLDGFAVRCWAQFFTDLGCAACAASGLLNEAHIPASCEADTNGTLTQLMLQWISGAAVVDMDIVDFDTAGDTAVVWHCGKAPLSMADPAFAPQGTLHSNRKMPLLLEFPLKPGRVTLARLSEASGVFRLVIGGGEMLAAPPAFSGTSGTIRFDRGAAAVLDTLLHEGLEHHVALVYGDHQTALHTLARMLNFPVLEL